MAENTATGGGAIVDVDATDADSATNNNNVIAYSIEGEFNADIDWMNKGRNNGRK